MVSSLLSVGVCGLALYRLGATPLRVPSQVLLAVAILTALVPVVMRSRDTLPRPLTGLRHVTTALGLFFLLVSFSLP